MTTLDDRTQTVAYTDALVALTEAITALPVTALDGPIHTAVEAGEFDDLSVAFDTMADLDELIDLLKKAAAAVAAAREQIERHVVRTQIRTQIWRSGRKQFPELGIVAERERVVRETHDPDAAARLAAPFLLVDPDTGERLPVPASTAETIMRRAMRFLSSPRFKKTEFRSWGCDPDAIAEVIRTEDTSWRIKVTRKPVTSHG